MNIPFTMRRWFAHLIIVGGAVLASLPALAQDSTQSVAEETPLGAMSESVATEAEAAKPEKLTPEQEALYRDVANNLRCPTCVGVSVLDSEAGFSVQIKDAVRRQVSEGKAPSEITAFFVERYGPWILRSPPKEGFDLIAWLVPIGLLLLGPLVVWGAVWRRKKEFDTHGIRSAGQIMAEMDSELRQLREKGSV